MEGTAKGGGEAFEDAIGELEFDNEEYRYWFYIFEICASIQYWEFYWYIMQPFDTAPTLIFF
jgi:hypothetical protein